MKTLSKILTIGLIISLFSACAIFRRKTVAEALEATTQVASRTSATHDEGVVINGVRWATRNVDMPGTFAPTPESSGMFFQWNRKKAWNATDRYVEGWDNTPAEGTKWYAENDPCPQGWRVPTRAELYSLRDAGHELTTINGASGSLFGIVPNQIFLSFAGFRNDFNGLLVNVHGIYWSSTQDSNTRAWCLGFSRGGSSSVAEGYRASGFSVRCVAK